MANEIQDLRDLVDQLRAENEGLQGRAAASTSNADAGAAGPVNINPKDPSPVERLLYIPGKRKCPPFRGTSGIPVEDWVEEMRATLRTRQLNSVDQAYFIYDHLEGEAKDEIRYRPRAEREDPEKILCILQDMYGCSRSYVSLQQSFFSRRQQEGESLHEFSHALWCLMEKVERCAPRQMPDAPILLRDQFVEHVMDPSLRRELKRFVRQSPGCTLFEVRAEAIRWEREGRPEEPRVRSHSVPSFSAVHYTSDRTPSKMPNREITELRQLLEKQQEQLNKLTQGLLALQGAPRPPSRPTRPGLVICRRCQKPGHYARDCDNERVIPQSRVPPLTAAVSGMQEAGNFAPPDVRSRALGGEDTGLQADILQAANSLVAPCPKQAPTSWQHPLQLCHQAESHASPPRRGMARVRACRCCPD
ncbi:uncharacterized protein LOC121653904 [Melanotaenia boesemani]|uniref:uncharacterized protein LOC121653904 n=1 Tax=Melanotaenia boesemani TaxID=1250792 RepID=UPI001C03E1C5|nr:uncharacterized protein LOC121653904 [Melanotaenia boesemani]